MTNVRGCIQKFPDWPPGARTANGIQLSATRRIYISILCVSLVSFMAITLCVASQRVFAFVSVCFVRDSIRKLLGTPSYSTPILVAAYCSHKFESRSEHERMLFPHFSVSSCVVAVDSLQWADPLCKELYRVSSD
jgi:hypothetical protein